jgi:small GTP-binding protein
MLQKKICILGAFGVGKTSLVRRFVSSIFSDSYLTTVGVKVDKKVVKVGANEVTLIVWDVAGENGVQSIRMAYVRGAAGYFVVADGTRRETLEVAAAIAERVKAELGVLPFLLLVNKSDLADSWELSQEILAKLEGAGWSIRHTSAKTGNGVEEAFQDLAQRLVG